MGHLQNCCTDILYAMQSWEKECIMDAYGQTPSLHCFRRGPMDEATGKRPKRRCGPCLQEPCAVFWPALLRQGDYHQGEFRKGFQRLRGRFPEKLVASEQAAKSLSKSRRHELAI